MEGGWYERDVLDPRHWGLSVEEVDGLADRFRLSCQRFQGCFKTRTRDPSHHAFTYLRGLLTMAGKRNYASIARRVNGAEDDGQGLQHFMSDSPWEAWPVFAQIQREIAAYPELQGGMLTLDESGNRKAGEKSAGVARQYLGRVGKVDLGQVGVTLGYYQAGDWMMVDAELYLPEAWFSPELSGLRHSLHIPAQRTFHTKLELGLEMILRARANGLPFQVVGCDSLYGRDGEFRAALGGEGILYMAEVPSNTHVYLRRPEIGIPGKVPGCRESPPCRRRVLEGVKPVEVRELAKKQDLNWQRVKVRPCERGELVYECASLRVWTVAAGEAREEWLFLHREREGRVKYFLSNAPEDTGLGTLALWRSLRYFAERVYQDCKSEIGWDELMARKYRAWMHHAALTALAMWFIAETKLDWARRYGRDSELARRLEVEVLPALSVANVRELFRAAMPLEELSHEEVVRLVVKHLFHRSRSTRSRLKAQSQIKEPT